MRILWFSHIPLLPQEYGNSDYKGGNWIYSLKKKILLNEDIELAICFHSGISTEFKIEINGIVYYNIQCKKNIFFKAYSKLVHLLRHEDIDLYIKIIHDFKPDIIQIFGTEGGFGKVTKHIDIPVIIHVQGLINPCLDAWLPQRVSLIDTFLSTSIKSLVLGNGFYHRFLYFKKQAQRELEIIANNKNYFIRTAWDKSYITFLNPTANLFHCDEIIRDDFYKVQWSWPHFNGKYIFVSVINDDIYKGWDNILRISALLKSYSAIDFEWHVIGAVPSESELRLFEKKATAYYRNCNVVFKGKMDADSIITELQQAHLFLHVSHIDNSPNSVCEAMLLGMPVICSEVGGCSSLIVNEVNGYLLHDNDPFYWAAKILEILFNKETTQRIGVKAREDALRRHDPDKIISEIMITYKMLI